MEPGRGHRFRSGTRTHRWSGLVVALSALCMLGPGCAYRQLQFSTARQAQTVVELQYQQLLDNLAMFYLNPNALPSLATLKTGATQVGDTGTLGFLGVAGLMTTFGSSPTVAGTRTVVDQWGSSPVTDDNNLKLLSLAFRRAWGDQKARIELDDADDFAHDLTAQIATNADMSVDRDTLSSILSPSLLSSALAQLRAREGARSNPPPGTAESAAHERGQNDELKKLAQRLARVNELIDSDITSTLDEKIVEESYAIDKRALTVDLVRDPSEIEGKDLIVLADLPDRLLFRVFDAEGARVYNTDEQELIARFGALRNPIQELKKDLEDKWDENELTVREEREIIKKVADILGFGASLKPRFVPAEHSATGLAKAAVYQVNDLQKTLHEVPFGWFCFGPKKPKHACYVGRACFCGQECYVWVCPEGLWGLSQFSLAVQKLGTTFKDVQVVTAPTGIQFAPALTNTSR